MAAPASHIRVGGAWKKVKTKHVRVGGTWKKVKAEYVRVGGAWKKVYQNAFEFNATISANTQNYNLKSAAIAAGWDQVAPLKATVTINSGVYIGSASTGSYAFDTGATFPADSTLAVVNNGYILGAGGPASSAGGPSLRAQYALTVTNNGTVGGGGGGGATGTTASVVGSTGVSCDGGCDFSTCSTVYGYGGSGGSGAGNYTTSPSSGVAGTTGTYYVNPDLHACGQCSEGTRSASGFGTCYVNGGTGYTGGTLGSQGGGGGGAAGACTSGNASITWAVAGTRYGALN